VNFVLYASLTQTSHLKAALGKCFSRSANMLLRQLLHYLTSRKNCFSTTNFQG